MTDFSTQSYGSVLLLPVTKIPILYIHIYIYIHTHTRVYIYIYIYIYNLFKTISASWVS